MSKKKDSFEKNFSEYLEELEEAKIKGYLKGKPKNTVVKLKDGRAFKIGLFGRVVRVK